MLTETYIDALLVDEALADQVWGAWDAGEIGDESLADQVWELWSGGLIPDEAAAWAWWGIIMMCQQGGYLSDL